jgi:hypothetical protein
MRYCLIAVSLVCVLVFTAAAQAPSPKPGPEQKRLEVFVGNWTFEGEDKPGPGGPGGKVTYRSNPDAWRILCRASVGRKGAYG